MTTTPDGRLARKRAVDSALEQLRTSYGKDRVLAVGDGQGGAWVELVDVELSGTYVQSTTFAVFLLPFNLPGADIYPMFVRDDLTRRDDAPLGEGFQPTTLSWPGQPPQRPVIQVSRRTRGGVFTGQTAVQKVEKVLEWLRTR